MKHHVFGTTVNGHALHKLSAAFENEQSQAAFRKKHRLTPATLQDLYIGFLELYKHGETSTVMADCARVYKKMGFSISQEGTGWTVE